MGIFDFFKGKKIFKSKKEKGIEVDLQVLYEESLKREAQEPDKIEGDVLVYVNPARIVNGVYYVPKEVKRIDSWAFSSCKDVLERVVLHEGFRYIAEQAFENCARLKRVEVDKANEEMKSLGGFVGCSSLEHVDIPESVQVISWGAFTGCKNLKQIKLPDGCWCISPFAFLDCESLTELRMPASITLINATAFEGCSNLNVIFPDYSKYEDLGFFDIELGDELIEYPAGDVVIEEGALTDVASVACFDESTFSKVLASGYEGNLLMVDPEQESVVSFDLFSMKKQIEQQKENGEDVQFLLNKK